MCGFLTRTRQRDRWRRRSRWCFRSGRHARQRFPSGRAPGLPRGGRGVIGRHLAGDRAVRTLLHSDDVQRYVDTIEVDLNLVAGGTIKPRRERAPPRTLPSRVTHTGVESVAITAMYALQPGPSIPPFAQSAWTWVMSAEAGVAPSARLTAEEAAKIPNPLRASGFSFMVGRSPCFPRRRTTGCQRH